MYHHTHVVTFSTVSNHSYHLSYTPNDSNSLNKNINKGMHWGEENINADEAMEENMLQSNDNAIEYEEGKWFGLELEGCNMEFRGNKNTTSEEEGAMKVIKTRRKKKQKISLIVKKPFDISQLKICRYETEIIDKINCTFNNSKSNIYSNKKSSGKDIDYYQEQFNVYIHKNGLDNLNNSNEEEKAKRMEIARLAFLEFSRLKEEEINRLVEEELEKRIREKTIEGHISQEEEQKIWDDVSQQYNVLIPQAPPFVNIQRLFDLQIKEQQRNYRISKGSTIEVIDDPFKSNHQALSNSQSSISDSNTVSNNSIINQLNDNLCEKKKKRKGRHHKRKGEEEVKNNTLDLKTIALEKLKKLNDIDIHSTHTEIKGTKRNLLEEEDLHIKYCRTFNKKNNVWCPYCQKDKSNKSSTVDFIHHQLDKTQKDKEKVAELKNESITNNDNENYEENELDNQNDYNNNIDTDSNEEESDNNNNEKKDNDGIYDSEDEENKMVRESDKDSETKRKEARAKKKEKEKKAKLNAKNKSPTKSKLFNSKTNTGLIKKKEIKPQVKQQQTKAQQGKNNLPNYPQFNSNKNKEKNNIINNCSKVKKVIQSLHKQANINVIEDKMKSPIISQSQNQNISIKFKNHIEKEMQSKLNSNDPKNENRANSHFKQNNKNINNSINKNINQVVHLRNLSQQPVKPIQKKLNITNHDSNTMSKPSSSVNHNDSNPPKTNRTQIDWKKVLKPQLSAASTVAPISGTNFYNTKKIEYITNKDLNFGFEYWKENMKNSYFSTKNSRCNSGQQSKVIEEEEKKRKRIKKKTFSNLTDEELERKKKQISELMRNKSNPYSLYWPDKFLNNAYQMGMTSYKSINGVPIITLFKKKEETIDETFKQIQQELHKQKQREMSKYHNRSSLSFHPCLDKIHLELDQNKIDKYKVIEYPQIFKYFN